MATKIVRDVFGASSINHVVAAADISDDDTLLSEEAQIILDDVLRFPKRSSFQTFKNANGIGFRFFGIDGAVSVSERTAYVRFRRIEDGKGKPDAEVKLRVIPGKEESLRKAIEAIHKNNWYNRYRVITFVIHQFFTE